MRKSHFTEEQVAFALRQAEFVLLSQEGSRSAKYQFSSLRGIMATECQLL